MLFNYNNRALSLLIFVSLLKVVVNLTAEDIIVTGPGLRPQQVVLPARYFFIYRNNSEPLDENALTVRIAGVTVEKHPCRLWTQVLNRKDGSFIVRYKLYETCFNLFFDITYETVHIKSFEVEGPVYPEQCNCPVKNIDVWLESFGCKETPKQIQNDMRKYSNVDFSHFHEKAVQRLNNSKSSSVCHYVIKSNQVYRTCYGQHVDFKMFMDAILLSLTRKVTLPDCEFYSNLGDWPLMKSVQDKNHFPMFSWCSTKDNFDIVMPTYDLTESTLGMMGRVSLDMLSVQGNIDKTWDEKENKAFFRGRDSSRERLMLVGLSREHPELINASLTNFFFFPEMEKEFGPKVKPISFFKFFDYKYQINLDGTVAAYRFPYLLAGDTVVFKQKSKYYEHFSDNVLPWIHYIPVESDLSNLVELLQWAAKNDDKVKEIGRAGSEYARNNLLPHDIFCYHAHLFNEWSKKLQSEVVIRLGMELVQHKDDTKSCKCYNYKPRDEL